MISILLLLSASGWAGDGMLSVVRIRAKLAQSEFARIGAGYIRQDKRVVTAYHVLLGADSIEVKLKKGCSRSANVVYANPIMDVAILELGENTIPGLEDYCEVVGLTETSPLLSPTSNLRVVGHSNNIRFQVKKVGATHGGVRAGSLFESESGGKAFPAEVDKIGFIAIDRPLAQGFSGGPVILSENEEIDSREPVLGILIGRLRDRSMSFMIPADAYKDAILETEPIELPLTEESPFIKHRSISPLGGGVEPLKELIYDYEELIKPRLTAVIDAIDMSQARFEACEERKYQPNQGEECESRTRQDDLIRYWEEYQNVYENSRIGSTLLSLEGSLKNSNLEYTQVLYENRSHHSHLANLFSDQESLEGRWWWWWKWSELSQKIINNVDELLDNGKVLLNIQQVESPTILHLNKRLTKADNLSWQVGAGGATVFSLASGYAIWRVVKWDMERDNDASPGQTKHLENEFWAGTGLAIVSAVVTLTYYGACGKDIRRKNRVLCLLSPHREE